MKKLLISLGTVAVATTPILVIGCSSKKDSTTEAEPTPIVFDLKTLDGITSLYKTFIENDSAVSSPELYQFKIGDDSITNDWTAAEISDVTTITGEDEGFDISGMEINEAASTLEDAFDNLPRLEDWNDFITDEGTVAKDGVANHYLYYADDETTADPDNADGSWDHKPLLSNVYSNSKGHSIYENSKELIIDAFGELPNNVDLYHVERGGDSAKNLYFKLIDRDKNEISDQIKIDVKWGSTQADIDSFGNGWFSKIITTGKKLIGKFKELLVTIVEKNGYAAFKPFVRMATGYILEKASSLLWTIGSKFLTPFSMMLGAETAYGKLMEKPIEAGTEGILNYLDTKFTTS